MFDREYSFLVLGLLFGTGIGTLYGLNVPADYEVKTVALCKEMDTSSSQYDWRCRDNVVLEINGYRTSVHEMPKSVWKSEPHKPGYLGSVENQSLFERYNLDRVG